LGGDLLTGGFTDSDSWRLGVMAGYARDYNLTHSSVSDYRSKGCVRGYSAGLYATWFANMRNSHNITLKNNDSLTE
ncbi:autotransporter outer membrane beta-barrel domain-containing protein, partial [Escherichia coli]|nr:autotransporter outer membrane beta-barrel domain-containing protein [Escherichia coli]